MCNLYTVQGAQAVPESWLFPSAPDPSLLAQEGWVVPFNRPLMPIVITRDNVWVGATWTLMPPWVKPEDACAVKKQPRLTANARSETLFELPSFSDCATNRRCLVLATGFREWHREDPAGRRKTPYTLGLKDHRPFFMAGIYSHWNGGVTYSIVTMKANKLMSFVHNGHKDHWGRPDPRMPVIVPSSDWQIWLAGGDQRLVEHLFIPSEGDLVGEPEKGQPEFEF